MKCRVAFLASVLVLVNALVLDCVAASSALPRSTPFQNREVNGNVKRFTAIPAQESGLKLPNSYEDPLAWGPLFREFNNGSLGTGVAVGDIDNDGLPDILVSNKTAGCRLYKNNGNFHFDDITESAGLSKEESGAWATLSSLFSTKTNSNKPGVWNEGVALVDVNNDGWLDIYICRTRAPNLLYINQKNGRFREEGESRGLGIIDASVMAAFCDYDRDGRLDLLLQTNLLDVSSEPNGRRNYLFHNKGDGYYEDVSGLLQPNPDSQGHSAFWWDYDDDGWPDLYIANDFEGSDRLYHNINGKRFVEVSARVLPHTPFSSMGCDAADVDGDGLIDLFVADMASRTHEKDQRTLAPARYSQKASIRDGSRQLAHNALYLSTGSARVKEAAFLAGLSASDWTWSVRFEDFDDDGWVDLFVTTGMNREHHNLDLIARSREAANPDEQILLTKNSAVFREANLAFRNDGQLNFVEVGKEWGLDEVGVSFGCATGDFDGDGDLDIVVTNLDAPPTIYRNNSITGHRVIFELRGHESNRFGVGAIVRVKTREREQVAQLSSARGYQSTSEPMLHFGLGSADNIERVEVAWPSGKRDVWENLRVDHRYTLEESGAASAESSRAEPPLFVEKAVPLAAGSVPASSILPPKITHRLMPFKINPRESETVNLALHSALGESGFASAFGEVLADRANEAVGAVAAARLSIARPLVVFVGRRSLPGLYPASATSSLFVKNDTGWSDEVEQLAPELKAVGNVTAALWSDYNNDGYIDLIVATDWGSLHCFENVGGKALRDVSAALGFTSAGRGWWRSIAGGDFNGDGVIDYAVGNAGLNTQYSASPAYPALLYFNPKAGNGHVLIEGYFENEQIYPWRSRAEIAAQLPGVSQRFPNNNSYAKATIEDVLNAAHLTALPRVEVSELRSGVFMSGSNGNYHFLPLPRSAQISSAQAIVAGDFDGDGHADLYIVQNTNEPTSSPWDGGLSQLLIGDGHGEFRPISVAASGLSVAGPTNGVEAFDENNDGWADFAISRSEGPPLLYINQGTKGRHSLAVHFEWDGHPENMMGARVEYDDRGLNPQFAEVYSNSGYLERGRAVLFFGKSGQALESILKVRWPDGSSESARVSPAQSSVVMRHP